MSEFRREIRWKPAFDNRSEGRGVVAVVVTFALIGAKGAITMDVSTGWYRHDQALHNPMPMGLDYHSPVPINAGQQPAKSACPLLGGEPCYLDGSYCLSEQVFDKLITAGEEAMWAEMAFFYHHWLEQSPEKAVAGTDP